MDAYANASPKEVVESIFTLAGLRPVKVWRLENRYWPTAPEYDQVRKDNPWWLVKTEFGLIEIGPRKRVLHIDWSETGMKAIVTDETNVTKSESMVHAWTIADAIKYLSALAVLLRKHQDLVKSLRSPT